MPTDKERLLAERAKLEADREELEDRLVNETSHAKRRVLRGRIDKLNRRIADIDQLLGMAAATNAIAAFHGELKQVAASRIATARGVARAARRGAKRSGRRRTG